jgi:DNA primase
MPKKLHIESRKPRADDLQMWKKYTSPRVGSLVISFYSEIAEVLLHHLRDRPLTLKRYPEGIHGEHFYEKNAPSHTPSWVKRFAVPRSEGGTNIHYVICNDRADSGLRSRGTAFEGFVRCFKLAVFR